MTSSSLQLSRLSIELTNACEKRCWFCYNHSHPQGETRWDVETLLAFVHDCAKHGVTAVSLGGGEPLGYAGLFDLLDGLRGVVARTLTTHGLTLDDAMIQRLAEARVDKVHVSIHFPERHAEVKRVLRQVCALDAAGVPHGVNLLVARSKLADSADAARTLRDAGVDPRRIVYLPMRGQDTPTPRELAQVAGSREFQSMTCLSACGRSPQFCSVGWDQRVGWCSYTATRRRMASCDWRGLVEALDGLGLEFCGGAD